MVGGTGSKKRNSFFELISQLKILMKQNINFQLTHGKVQA